jgi:GNAT superfamily N-acetyltransferase
LGTESSQEFPEALVRLRSGEEVLIRLLREDDGAWLAAYLEGLCAETCSYYRPHPFDRETADRICDSLASSDKLRFVALSRSDGDDRIVAYVPFKLGVRDADRQRYAARGIELDAETDTTIAPSVADEYQGAGLAGAIVRYLVDHSRALGRTRMVLWGGVQARNARAIAFYRKCGFREMGEFWTDQNNFDMLASLE